MDYNYILGYEQGQREAKEQNIDNYMILPKKSDYKDVDCYNNQIGYVD